MKPPLLIIAILAATLCLTGCPLATIPLPPSGANAGKYGYLQVGYLPNVLNTPEEPLTTTK